MLHFEYVVHLVNLSACLLEYLLHSIEALQILLVAQVAGSRIALSVGLHLLGEGAEAWVVLLESQKPFEVGVNLGQVDVWVTVERIQEAVGAELFLQASIDFLVLAVLELAFDVGTEFVAELVNLVSVTIESLLRHLVVRKHQLPVVLSQLVSVRRVVVLLVLLRNVPRLSCRDFEEAAAFSFVNDRLSVGQGPRARLFVNLDMSEPILFVRAGVSCEKSFLGMPHMQQALLLRNIGLGKRLKFVGFHELIDPFIIEVFI